jgi:hypothetical protein
LLATLEVILERQTVKVFSICWSIVQSLKETY